MAPVAHALTIAGSDPSGGAGIQADLKTFHAFGVYGMAVLTSLTAQNTRGVTGIHDAPPDFVAAQLAAVLSDVRVDAAKTGMLKSPEVIEVVAGALAGRNDARLVVDPVMVATSGDRLIDDAAIDTLRRRLLPLAAVVTPNLAEAGVLAEAQVESLGGARDAARKILETGARAVLVTGIPEGCEMIDLLLGPEGESLYRRPRLSVGATHGTGCTLSSAITAGLASGRPLLRAVEEAKDFVFRAIRDAFPVGGGSLPLNHHVGRVERLP